MPGGLPNERDLDRRVALPRAAFGVRVALGGSALGLSLATVASFSSGSGDSDGEGEERALDFEPDRDGEGDAPEGAGSPGGGAAGARTCGCARPTGSTMGAPGGRGTSSSLVSTLTWASRPMRRERLTKSASTKQAAKAASRRSSSSIAWGKTAAQLNLARGRGGA